MGKKKKQLVSGLILGMMVIGLFSSGCSLVDVNPEKEGTQVIAEIGEETILKSDFNNYMAYYNMYYKSGGMEFPAGDELKALKTDVLDDLVRLTVLSKQAKDDNLSPDETMTSVDVETMIGSLKTTMGDAEYEKILGNYNSNEDAYRAFLSDLMDKMAYASVVEKNFREDILENPQAELDKVVGTIGGEDVTRKVYNYQLVNQELNYFRTNQAPLPIDENNMKLVNEDIFKKLARDKVFLSYADEAGINIDQAQVSDYQSAQEAFIGDLFPEGEGFQDYLDSKLLTVDQFKAFAKDEAVASVTGLAIRDQLSEEIEVKDSEIKSVYNKNKDSYDQATVSAQHILTEDQALSEQIYQEAKGIKTKEAFTGLMEKYQGTEGIVEASDLGTFGEEKMVAEFSQKAFSMDVNTVGQPVKTDFGYHIIFVYDKNEGTVPSLEDKEDEIRDQLTTQKTSDAFMDLEEQLLKKEKIEIGHVQEPFVIYIEELKEDMNVKTYDNRIK